MRTIFNIHLIAAIALTAGGVASAQQAKPPVEIDIKTVKVTAVPTPQFAAANVPDKRWRPKTWLEIDVDMTAKKTKTLEDASTVIDALEVKLFVALNAKGAAAKASPAKKRTVITATFNVINVPANTPDHAHVLAFVSPAALVRLLESNNFVPSSDIEAVGVEINFAGQPVGYYSHPVKPYPQRFWLDLSVFNTVDGVLLPKMKTPFAPLWGDYDVEVKQ
jgi:hypothetical protein